MKGFVIANKDDFAIQGGDATILQKPDILKSRLPLWDWALTGQQLVAVKDR
jgi:hypothetical protein